MPYMHGLLKISNFLNKSPPINSAKHLGVRPFTCLNKFSIQSTVNNETRQRLQCSKRNFKLLAVSEIRKRQQERLFHSSRSSNTDSSSISDSTHHRKVSEGIL